ncbi:MAG: LamG domain-containing protein, partial [Caulobacteraceae bacterium]|nr:LamG domain-containing protein [Caulobacteraceae bacterium]
MTIAATPSGTAVFTGYQSNFRVVTGTAVYTAAFTPPTSPLTAIANTSLLTCQSNRFRDASSNNFAITVNGDTSVQAFSPFAPTAAYSAATVGGSGYFDGSGDYLTVPDNAAYEVGSDNFTEEFWIYPTSASMTGSIIDKRSSAGNYSECPQIQIASNQPIAYVSYSGSSWAVNINGSSNVKPYSWNHIALTRSSSTWTLWLNGASVGSATSSGTVYAGSSSLVIGAASSAGEVPITGYLSSVRIVKGTALYTSAFTPPTAPLTAVANTQLLLNFT